MDTEKNIDNNSISVSGLEDLLVEKVEELYTRTKQDRLGDVILVVKDGIDFKVHRDVLVESSPFFEKLLNTDMKESKERVIQLEILSESVMKDILEFIYTGTIDLLTDQNAEELIKAADYLLLFSLKSLAGRFMKKTVSVSNCLSYLSFAEKYRCQELMDYTENFMCSNFLKESERFLNLSSQEVERWISKDDIVVSAEKDVFEFICRWIKRKKDERKPKFGELFRHVRLIFIPHDYLSKKIKKQNLVKNSEQCLNSVTSAINWLDQAHKVDLPRPQSMRRSMEMHVIIIVGLKNFVCYVPDTNTWLELPKSPLLLSSGYTYAAILAARSDKVYKFSPFFYVSECYDPLFNRWRALPESTLPEGQGKEISHETQVYQRKTGIFKMDAVTVIGEDIYAIFHTYRAKMAVWKYDLESCSWLFISFFQREEKFLQFPCVVFVDTFVYSIGGITVHSKTTVVTKEAGRLDLSKEKWEEIAEMQVARYAAIGTAANGKIFVAGGNKSPQIFEASCEVYNIETNEWHFMASLTGPSAYGQMLYHGTKLYLVAGSDETFQMWIECYDLERNEWITKVPIPPKVDISYGQKLPACLIRVPKKTLDTLHRL